MIILPEELWKEIRAHAQESYPYEGCGIVVGTLTEPKRAVRVYRAANLNRERAQDRYLMDPADITQAEKEAGEAGLAVIGFYHSHPDHPAIPSQFDLQQAKVIIDAGWPPIYSYIIVSVNNGQPGITKSWVLNEEKGIFEPEELTSAVAGH